MSKENLKIYDMGLVLEGGGMRGLYTAGVLDAFLDEGMIFRNCIGVSAGICHACSYYSLQRGRAMRVNIDYLDDRNYCSVYSLIRTGDLFGADFLYRKIPEELYPIDNETFKSLSVNLYSTVTNCENGKAEYIRINDMLEDVHWVRASASLPLVSRIVKIGGGEYLDGGIADSIPIKKSEAMGFAKNIVVLTQPRDYVKKPLSGFGIMKIKYRRYRNLLDSLKNRHIVYNSASRYIKEQEERGNTLVIAPKEPLNIGRVEKDKAKLMAIYELGLKDGHEAVKKIKEFAAN